MNRRQIGRLAFAAAACAALALPSSPAGAVDLKDLGRGLGIDLDTILGGRGDRSGGASLRLVESILEKELPRHVGPAQRYEVRLGRSGNDLRRGFLSQVDVTGFDVRTDDGLVIPKMEMKLEGVRVGLGSRTLEGVGKSLFSASLGEEAVSSFVTRRAGVNVRDVRVGFRSGEIQVKGTPEVLGFGLPSEVRGKPVVTRGDTIDFRAGRVSVLGLGLPRIAVDRLEDRINPVVDLSGLKLPVRITEIRVVGDRLVADGALNFDR